MLALDDRGPLVIVARRPARTRERLEICTSGLLCLWRTRVPGEQGRPRPPLLTAIFVACRLGGGRDRRGIATFVTTTLERCRSRIDVRLDRELDRAIVDLHDRERAWDERRACRDAAIAAALRTRTHGPVQPWLFEHLAIGHGLAGSAGSAGFAGFAGPSGFAGSAGSAGLPGLAALARVGRSRVPFAEATGGITSQHGAPLHKGASPSALDCRDDAAAMSRPPEPARLAVLASEAAERADAPHPSDRRREAACDRTLALVLVVR